MKLNKILSIIQLVASAVLLLAILAIWIAMHVYGMTYTNTEVYYANISAAIPAGIVLIAAIISLVKPDKKK